MNVQVAIIIGAVLISLSIIFIFRWQAAPIGGAGVILLDRWTSAVTVCLPPVGEPPQTLIYKKAVRYNCNVTADKR